MSSPTALAVKRKHTGAKGLGRVPWEALYVAEATQDFRVTARSRKEVRERSAKTQGKCRRLLWRNVHLTIDEVVRSMGNCLYVLLLARGPVL